MDPGGAQIGLQGIDPSKIVMMTMVNLSPSTYRHLQAKARARSATPDQVAEELLRQQLLLDHPYVHVVERIGGPQAVLRDTRIPVSIIVGYLRLGETPESIVADVLPSLTLAQVYDVLSYYDEHREEVDLELSENTQEHWRTYLRQSLSDVDYSRITGQLR